MSENSFKYNNVILDEIVDRIANGETMTRICGFGRDNLRRDPGTFPTPGTVYLWTYISGPNYMEEFAQRLAAARFAQQHTWVEQAIDIADNFEMAEEITEEEVDMGGEKPYTKSIRRVTRKDATTHRQMRINTRQKAVAMFNPDLWAAKAKSATGDDDDDSEVTVHGGLPD